MHFKFLWIGKTKDPVFRELEDRYLERIRRFFKAQRVHSAEYRKKDSAQKSTLEEKEARSLEKKLPSKGYVILLDENGSPFNSRQFAGRLEHFMERGVPEIVFIIGGYAGVPKRIRSLADEVLSLGPMTLPHELARVVLLEQVYRAISIIKGLPYHK